MDWFTSTLVAKIIFGSIIAICVAVFVARMLRANGISMPKRSPRAVTRPASPIPTPASRSSSNGGISKITGVVGVVFLVFLFFAYVLPWYNGGGAGRASQEATMSDSRPRADSLTIPATGSNEYSRRVPVPLGWHLCSRAANGTGSYQWQFHPVGNEPDDWADSSDLRVNMSDGVRYRSNGEAQTLSYYYTFAGQPC